MAKDLTDLQLLTELEPVVEQNVNRHMRMRKDWNPHDYIPWSDGKNYYALGGQDWDPEQTKRRLCIDPIVWTTDGKKDVKEKFLTQENFDKLMRLDDWNDVVILGKGKNIKHYLNGQLVVDFTDEEPKLAASEGIMALQLHAGAPMWVEFKNIRLKQAP